MSKETKRGIALQGAAGALGRKRLPRAGLGVFNRPSLPPPLPCAGDTALSMSHWMFDQSALQEYILLCCQCPAGGLLDKPGK